MTRSNKNRLEDRLDEADVMQSLQSKRTKTSTKKTYSSKITTLISWLKAHRPNTVDESSNAMCLPLPKDVIMAFFGHICSAAQACDQDNMASSVASSTPLAVSTVWGFRSALVDVYRKQNVLWDSKIDDALCSALEGYEKTINDLKKRGLMKVNEGKHQLTMSGFELVLLKMMSLEPNTKGQAWSTVVFGWCFLVLTWNLMSRADSIATIIEQGHKGDQTGSKKVAKHVYANPYQPHQCPILALAVHLFSCPERSCSGKQQFFIGSDSKDRFGRILRRVVNSLSADELCQLSCASEDIGTHSLRKGSSSYALGQVNGPTPVSVYLRMGQSLGNVKDRYIHFGEGADQLCGRMITGLPFDSERFGVIPPHFPPRLASKLTIEFWDRVVSEFSKYTRGMQSAFPFMLASLIHHEQYLRNTISPNHPIFKSRVFSANPLLQELRGSTVLSLGTSPVSGLKATGIPVHLAIAKQVAGLKEAVSSLRDGITALEDKMPNVVASTVVSELRHHLAVNGGAISLQEFDSRIMNMEARITERVCSAIRDVQLPRDNPEAVQSGDQRNWRTWSWKDGKIGHAVPRGWKFPARTNVKVLWNM
ncbi:hypothetical protein P3T76_011220 [Phytophthora citrophthora]|uniref:Ndc10 domain-containing protein n=1 Tax=Phytophthora citrophthora TaxID=4793 RepID=A0AAD9LFL9_9STRA|nr:hypothetical protein P3T76_011220 [Phytophthora citrophthora]